MQAAGVPVVPGAGTSAIDPLRLPRDSAFPPGQGSAGGGGKGMRVVDSEEELVARVVAARREADAAFGNESFLERFAPRPTSRSRCSATPGRVVALPSVIARSNGVTRSSSRSLRHRARRDVARADGGDSRCACEAIGYRNAGTFEFLVGPDGAYYFIEVNCRLQVEHPVSELVTGIDIVREQIRSQRASRSPRPVARPGAAMRSRSGSTPRIPPVASFRRRARSRGSSCRSGLACAWTRQCSPAPRSRPTTTP